MDLKSLYETDTVAWSEQQAAALRAAARGGSSQPLDWENLAEEIESLGRSLKLGLRSQVVRIIQHLVKLAHSPALDRAAVGGAQSAKRGSRSILYSKIARV